MASPCSSEHRRFVYDTGALLAAERRGIDIWAHHRRALDRGRQPLVPTVVVAQAWRGGPQAALSRFLEGCVVVGFDERAARQVGRALATSETSDIVDAAVVLCAVRYGCAAVTSDPDDLRRIATALGRDVPLVSL